MKCAVLCSITTIAGSALAAPIFEWDPDSIAFTGWEKREAQPWFPKPFGWSQPQVVVNHVNSKREADAKPIFEWDPESIAFTGWKKRNAEAKPIFEWDPDSIAFTGFEKREALAAALANPNFFTRFIRKHLGSVMGGEEKRDAAPTVEWDPDSIAFTGFEKA